MTMKYCLFYIGIIFFTLLGCEKDMMNYEGSDSVYFDVQYQSNGESWYDSTRTAHQYYKLLAFGNADLATTELDFKIKVAVAGSIKDYDRPFSIEVVKDSSTALENEDFVLSGDNIIQKGANCTYITIKVYRSEKLKEHTLSVLLHLLPNEHFRTDISDVGVIPGRLNDLADTMLYNNPDPRLLAIFFDDKFIAPKAWNDYQLGECTEEKFELVLRLTGWDEYEYFRSEDSYNKMLGGKRYLIIQSIVGKYIMEQYRKGNYDEITETRSDGKVYMMYMRGAGLTWGANTLLEDMQR